jgi:hypothetical protein
VCTSAAPDPGQQRRHRDQARERDGQDHRPLRQPRVGVQWGAVRDGEEAQQDETGQDPGDQAPGGQRPMVGGRRRMGGEGAGDMVMSRR